MASFLFNLSINEDNTPHSNNMKWSTGNWLNLYKVTKNFEYSSTNFRTNKRSNQFAIGVSSIILDFDENVSLDEAKNIFSEFHSLIVTTKSHKKKKQGIVCDRFRVILPLNYSIIDMSYYMNLMKIIVRHFKADLACTDAARYYSPNAYQKTYYSQGNKFFDVRKFEKNYRAEQTMPYSSSINAKICLNKTQKIDLSKLLKHQITYYQYGRKTIDTLNDILNNENHLEYIKCHCFLNPSHEDNNPSCVIYLNHKNIFIKCFACDLEHLIEKEKI